MFLVVDDSMVMRKIISNVLIRSGIKPENIIQAENGLDAWEKLNQYKDKINVIFLDWNMPVMDGFTFLKKVRANSEFNKIKIVMVTTEGGKKEVIMALKAGVNNYIVKPFTPDILKKKLSAMGIIN